MTGSDIALAALRCVGISEAPRGSNRGPEVDTWTGTTAPASVRGPKWCGYFASAMVRAVWPGFPVLPGHGQWIEWANKNGRRVRSGRLLPGDVFVIDRPDGTGHVGIVLADNGDGTCASVEGNEGQQVRARLRSGVEFACVLRVFPA